MTEFKRALIDHVINLSVSESEDSEKHGFPAWQVNRTVLQIVSAFFGQGLSIAFGHDWRNDGVMEAVHGFAQQMQAPVPLSAKEARDTHQPLLWNLLPWPDKPQLEKDDLERLASTLRIECAGLPEDLKNIESDILKAKNSDDIYIYARARGLTFLRHKLNKISNARLCIGGRRSGSQGRYPGIIEEALLGLRAKKPLYFAGLLGGATQQVIDAIEGKPMPEEFSPPSLKLSQIYKTSQISIKNADTNADCQIDRNAIWAEFNQAGKKQIAATNGLTEKENEELFHTPSVEDVIRLVLTGLSRLKH